jgi:S1-C subfamily serine protease
LSPIDVVIIVFALALAAIGWERGLVGSAVPLAGFIAGVAVGARLAPTLLEDGAESRYAPAIAAAGGILLGLFLAIALEGVGAGLRERLERRPLTRVADSLGGALLLAVLGLAIAWVFGAVALHTPASSDSELRRAAQKSDILVALNDAFPPSGELLNVLRRIDPTPAVRGPDADVPKPNAKIVNDADVEAASQSVVRVRGTACGLGIEGSGWIAGDGVVVTNAHVVAGADDTSVTTPSGQEVDATAVRFDVRNDLAVLAVPGVAGAPLKLEPDPEKGTEAAAVGYPQGGPLTITPARLGRTGKVTSDDAYGNGPVQRKMTAFRGDVRNGNSGGPVIGPDGDVLTTVFAASLDDGPPSGLGVPNSIVAKALGGRLEPVDTGPCTT